MIFSYQESREDSSFHPDPDSENFQNFTLNEILSRALEKDTLKEEYLRCV